LTASRAVQAAAGVLILALPSSAYALTEGGAPQPRPARAATAPRPTLTALPWQLRLHYGHDVIVRGRVAGARTQAVTLEYESAGSRSWRPLDSTRPGRRGRFTLRAAVDRSGHVRVVGRLMPQAWASIASAARIRRPRTVASRPEAIAVAASLNVHPASIDALAGHAVSLTGRLLPGTGGRIVRLLAGAGRHWTRVATASTRPDGRFALRFAVPVAETTALKVEFGGDPANLPAAVGAGRLTSMVERVASWYYDAGQTACGFHATYGIASRTLPCGSHVTLSYGGRTVIATVDDRGPFVAGRDYDLNQNTAAALGMYGVATVLSSV
jgi:hypothetical protein